MYRILIADDEVIVRNAFKLMIERNFNNVQLVAEASNGIEAVELARAYKPHIIIMDIKMPGINGLKAIDEIKKFDSSIKFLVLTAYCDFEYAQKALKMGVEDYVLKPINMKKIVDTISGILDKINDENKQRESDLSLRDKVESVKPFLEREIIYAVIAGGNAEEVIRKYSGFLEMDLTCAFCVAINVEKSLPSITQHQNLDDRIRKQQVYNMIVSSIKEICKCLTSDFINDNIIILIPVSKNFDRYKNRIWAVDLANFVKNCVEAKTNVKLTFGIGGIYEGYSNIYKSYVEAVKALKYANDVEEIINYDSINTNVHNEFIYPFDLEKKLCEKVAVSDMDSSLKILECITNRLIEGYAGNYETIKAKVYELVLVVQRYLAESVRDICQSEYMKRDILSELNRVRNLENLNDWTVKSIKSMVELAYKNKKSRIDEVIESAVEYISKNYCKEITLDEVALEVGLSSYYLSKLFKQRIGKNFIDFIAELRINKAKDLLKSKRQIAST